MRACSSLRYVIKVIKFFSRRSVFVCFTHSYLSGHFSTVFLFLQSKTLSVASYYALSAFPLLLGGRKGIRPVKTEWWGAGVVICLERGADLHTAQLMPLPLTVSCFSKIQIGLTFLVLAHLGSSRQRVVKCVCVCSIIVSHGLTLMKP